MAKVIRVKYLGPTANLGGRLSVVLGFGGKGNRKIYPWDCNLSIDDNYRQAAKMFLYDKRRYLALGLIGGWLNQNTMVFLIEYGFLD